MFSTRANRWKSSCHLISDNQLTIIKALSPLPKTYIKRKHIGGSKAKLRSSLNQHMSAITVADIDDDENKFLIKYQINEGKPNIIFPHIIKDHLKKYTSFYNMIREEYDDLHEEILLKLSTPFSLIVYHKNSIIFRFNDIATHYHIILKGKVDVLFPYYEKIQISPEEMIIYLLRLKQYNETELLAKVIEMNSAQFLFGDNKFDIWITQAYNTLLKLQRFLREDGKKDSNFLGNSFDCSNNDQDSKHKKYNNGDEMEKIEEIRLFNYAKDIKFVNKIEYELIEAIKVANPKLLGNTEKTHIKIIGITSQEYITRIYPPILQQINSLKREVTVIKYYHDRTYHLGDHYGEIAMNANDQSMPYPLNRLYTVITKEDCHIGKFTKKAFFDHIKAATEKKKRANVELLKEFCIFRKSQNNYLLKNYATFFNEIKTYHNDFIIEERMNQSDNRKIFFIKEGEFEVVCIKSISEIDQMLTELGFGEIIQDKIRTNTTPETDDYFKAINIRTKFRLNYFRYNDIVGLPDCHFKGIYLYSVQCQSKTGILLEINMNLLEYIMSLDVEILKSAQELIISKRRLFAELLFKQRGTKIDFNHAFKKNLQYPSKAHHDIEIFKRKSNVPYIPRMVPNFILKDNDIDLTLVNSSSKYTLEEIRHRNKMAFIQKYNEKMRRIKIKKRDNFKMENRLLKSASVKEIEFKYDAGRNKNHDLSHNTNSSSIDPLVFDNIDRMYNTQFYFQKVFDCNDKKQRITIKVENEQPLMRKKSRSSSNIYNYNINKNMNTDRYGVIDKEGKGNIIKDRERSLQLTTIKLRSIYDSKSCHKRVFHR